MAHEAKIAELEQKRNRVRLGGGQEQIERQHARGKLTARERLDLLLDKDSFTEADVWVRNRCPDFDLYRRELPGEGVVTGSGRVDGRRVFVFAHDYTLMGGSLGEAQGLKICRLLDRAMRVGSPVIGLNDSGGARVQEGMGALHGYCSVFYRTSIASGWIPQISLIMGPCAGGAVYSPALTDFIIMVNSTSYMFITGPAVVKAVTGEEVTFDQLGGPRVHGNISGVAHFVVASEQEGIALARRLLSFLPDNSDRLPPKRITEDPVERREPSLAEAIPEDPSRGYDIRKVIELTVDEGDFLEVHRDFAQNMVVGFARLGGQPVGIVANQPRILAGCIDVDASCKAARFVRFCDAFNFPLITLVDCPGYLPGLRQEHMGIIRHGAKLLYAYSEATVPKITVIVRKDYGGAYSAMCGKGLGADVVLAMVSAEVAVMGPEAAAGVVFRREIENAPDPEARRREMIREYRERFATPYKAAEWGIVDDVIEPQELRPRLVQALRLLEGKRESRPRKKHCNLPL